MLQAIWCSTALATAGRCVHVLVRGWVEARQYAARERARCATLVSLAVVLRGGGRISDGGVNGLSLTVDGEDESR